ncbi:unnamed protein product [Rotaria magnacalcarata]|uniref:Uncharacterized protein n=6 Tax=Rotaria magnacalcarata TaxID=392030 RepID=A0A815XFZ7_9BILA|nr:unnamed protein product [Rotaria magnacalcarata]CAF2052903.1 unnamed protein product [Rotaria magnacalcarata]CAF2135929.1 unnamed protein product [Rotaria magnacalcarata]CAF3895103.1 unnamed protein product [Rotaria magnacalcarata]CAF3953788.1 unnamed protein product [Rotaria magnacalcarata]
MGSGKSRFMQTWRLFSVTEKRNIIIYIIGLMLYKFGLEAFNGSIVTLATNRYDEDALRRGISSNAFERVGLLSGLNQAFQCIGSILVAPFTRRWSTRTVLSISIFCFALFSSILLILDAATGGHIKPLNFVPTHNATYSYYGKYNTNGIIPIYCITGITYGMVELIRRVIPRDIVGDNGNKLQKMNALVHIFYEITGVSGAFATGLGLIPRLGNNYAFIVTPICFTAAAIIWLLINSSELSKNDPDSDIMLANESNYFKSVLQGFFIFGQSIFIGAKIIFAHRKFIWLWTCYTLTLYAHRYIENGTAPQIAKRYLGQSEWSQIIVGGSNLGELLGALFIFCVGTYIKTPLPWSRLDALMLLIVWYIPYYYPPMNNATYAWIVAATYLPIGFASATNDIALNSFIQSSLSGLESKHKNISVLSAVAAFLYSSYIIIYAILNPLLGKHLDSVYTSTGTIRPAFLNTVAIQMTLISVLVIASTFIPKGSFAFNPKFIHGDNSKPTSNSATNDNSKIAEEKDTGSDLITRF